VSARNAMTHRCTVQRNSSLGGGTDPWGNDAASDWDPHLAGLSCRFWFAGGQTIYDGQKQVELTTRMLLVPEGTDITEDDRIVSVLDRRGRELADGPMRVDALGRRDGHLVATLVDDR
jgi:hypothetical protein